MLDTDPPPPTNTSPTLSLTTNNLSPKHARERDMAMATTRNVPREVGAGTRNFQTAPPTIGEANHSMPGPRCLGSQPDASDLT